jgi:hypothetical protein
MTQWGLDVLFNPAKRHMDEEKQRLQSTREEIGDASGGKRIDLESGKVVIPRSDAEGEAAFEDAGSSDVSAAENEADENRAAESKPADSAAARARARRRELRQRKA